MSLADDVMEFLRHQNLIDGPTGWFGAIGFTPTDPDKTITFYPTGGEPADTRQSLRYMSFQIKGRGDVKGYDALQQKMEAIYQALHTADLDDPSVSPTGLYVLCHATQSQPLSLGEDDNRRPLMTLNFRVISNA